MTGSLLLYLGLAVVIIIVIAIFVQQQQKKTEESVFKKLMNVFFPSKIETVVISGTTTGESCRKIELHETDQAQGTGKLAQAIVDCYKSGQYVHKGTIQCCYRIDTTKMKYTIAEDQIKASLKTKGQIGETLLSSVYCGQNFEWKVANPVSSAIGEFVVCYDYQSLLKLGSCDDVFLTTTPPSHCD